VNSTSERANWYLVYTPEAQPDVDALAAECEKNGLTPPKQKKEVFINYISPIHYNAVAALPGEELKAVVKATVAAEKVVEAPAVAVEEAPMPAIEEAHAPEA
jgi:hypothetical protein